MKTLKVSWGALAVLALLSGCKQVGPSKPAAEPAKASTGDGPAATSDAASPTATGEPKPAKIVPRPVERAPSPGPIDSLERLTDVALAAVVTGDASIYERVMFGADDARSMCPEMLAEGNAAIAQKKFVEGRQALTRALKDCSRFDWKRAKRLSESGGREEGPEPRCKDVIAHRPIKVHFELDGAHVVVRLTKPARNAAKTRWVIADPPSCRVSQGPLPIPKAEAFKQTLAAAIAFAKAACSCADEACHAAATAKYVAPMGDVAGPHRWTETEEAAIQLHLRNGQKCQPGAVTGRKP